MKEERRGDGGRVTDDRGRDEASATRSVEEEVAIEAAPERVWRALAEARELERWFPLEARVEPGEGGEIFMSWRNEYAGTSRILRWEPHRRLTISWGGLDGSEDSAQVTDFLLLGKEGRTLLRVVTSGFPDEASWDDWVEGTRHGWRFELASLRHYLERHPGEEREVVYLRRRVPLSRSEAWDRLFRSVGSRPLGGEPFVEEAPWQYAAVVDDPPEGLLRLTVEPCVTGEDALDATLFLSAWGGHRSRLEELKEEWTRRLAAAFPEGHVP